MKFLAQSLNNKNTGIYIHVPFCLSKCGYCDFYSFSPKENEMDLYVNKIISELNRWSSILCCSADTLYLGGGTPSLLKAERLNKIIETAIKNFKINGEITVEANPKDELDFENLKANRLSLGLQSCNDKELVALNRRHTAKDALNTILKAKKYFKNISLDIMLGIPYQTKESLKESLDFCIELNIPHISTYMLKIEKNTPFYKSALPFLNDEKTAELYLFTCEYLRANGYERYEISNFAKPTFESKHNMKYWLGADYLGLGPAAHSRIGNKRFYYNNDFYEYINKPKEIYEGAAGDTEEDIMLSLRTNLGYNFKNYPKIKNTAIRLAKNGLIDYNNDCIKLTDKGALLENSIIAELILNM